MEGGDPAMHQSQADEGKIRINSPLPTVEISIS